LVGIDVGTTRIKAGLIDSDGHELAQTQVSTIWRRDDLGTVASPQDFTDGVHRACVELLAEGPAGDVVGLGITSMAETVVLVGPDGDAVGPAVAWHDRRAQGDYDEMVSALSAETIRRVTGLNGDPVPTVAVLRYLMRTSPESRRATSVLSVGEWIAFGLCGTRASELSLASRTGALAIGPGAWWNEGIAWAGLEPSLFGELRPAGSSWGEIVNPPLGLERLAGATVTVAGHDHLAAAVGSGITGPGQIMDSCGTAEALLRAIDREPSLDPLLDIPHDIAIGWHVLPGCLCLLAGLPLGIELGPTLTDLGATQSKGRTSLDDAALQILSGEFSPSDATHPSQVWLSTLQRAVGRSAERRAELERLGGPIDEMRISGGWSQNPVLRRVKELEFSALVYPKVTEAGVRGSGLLAGLAAGVFPSVEAFPPAPLLSPDGDSASPLQILTTQPEVR
jgi:sugar (pentulose or hexulose) kinase